ncbi:CDP-alcohol phosphatidyltransferase [Pelomyxa schiedti]|nr:CDP-alcohol phosphatidyltransferase [Pelomyxa schiedti]
MWYYRYIGEVGLDNLKRYRYRGADLSISARLFLTRFWTWTTFTLVPMWLAPNVITLFGGCCVATCVALCAYFSPTMTEKVPAAAIAACAVLIYTYQLADNVDGKQAKRTGAGSPLGELFDHGVDSLVMGMMGVMLLAVVNAPLPLAVAGFISSLIPFWLAHWEEYHAGELIMGAFTGPTEMQHMFVFGLIFTMIVGPEFWAAPMSQSIDIPRLHFGLVFVISICLLISGISVFNVIVMVNNGKAESKATMGKAFSQLCSIIVFVTLSCIFTLLPSVTPTLHSHPYAYFLTLIAIFGYITQRLIVQRICHEEIRHFYGIYIPFAIAATHTAISSLLGHEVFVSNSTVMWTILTFSLLQELVFCYSIINQLTTHLKIRAFILPQKRL